ncbi:MAG: DUF3383 family protein [Lachnospiraceae bacterium]
MSNIRNNLDEIVKVDIEIGTPASSDASFDSILLVISGPASTGTATMSGVTEISEAKELTDYGYTTAHSAYVAATVAFSQSPAPTSLYVVERVEGESGYESMADCLNKALETGGWYGIHLESTFQTKSDIEATVKWVEANKKLYGFTITDITNIPSTTNYFRSYGVYGGGVPGVETQPEENSYIALAQMAKCFGYDPGSESWGLKALAGVSPCKLSSQLKKTLENANIAYFTTYASKNIINAEGGKVLGNEWIDTIRFRDWLQNDMQERIFNLFVLSQKVPFTDGGITAVQGKMEESLSAGQEVGGIAPTEYDDDDNEVPGFTTTVPASLDLTETQKASRKLTGCKFTARLAGAIQMAEVSGNLKY